MGYFYYCRSLTSFRRCANFLRDPSRARRQQERGTSILGLHWAHARDRGCHMGSAPHGPPDRVPGGVAVTGDRPGIARNNPRQHYAPVAIFSPNDDPRAHEYSRYSTHDISVAMCTKEITAKISSHRIVMIQYHLMQAADRPCPSSTSSTRQTADWRTFAQDLCLAERPVGMSPRARLAV